MTTPIAVSLAIIAVFFAYAVVAPVFFGLPGFMRTFQLACPHKPGNGDVRLEGTRAALTNAYGKPSLQVIGCSLLARGETCDRACLHNWKA
jgi:hypothetical protein